MLWFFTTLSNLCFNLQYFFCRRFYTGSLLSSCRHSRSSCNGHYSSRYLNLSPQPHWVCLRESKGDKSKFIAWKKEYLWSDGGKIMTNVWGYCQSFITANNMYLVVSWMRTVNEVNTGLGPKHKNMYAYILHLWQLNQKSQLLCVCKISPNRDFQHLMKNTTAAADLCCHCFANYNCTALNV